MLEMKLNFIHKMRKTSVILNKDNRLLFLFGLNYFIHWQSQFLIFLLLLLSQPLSLQLPLLVILKPVIVGPDWFVIVWLEINRARFSHVYCSTHELRTVEVIDCRKRILPLVEFHKCKPTEAVFYMVSGNLHRFYLAKGRKKRENRLCSNIISQITNINCSPVSIIVTHDGSLLINQFDYKIRI